MKTIQGNIMAREDIMRRWKAALQQKKETTAWMVAELTARYEKEHGEKPKYVEVW